MKSFYGMGIAAMLAAYDVAVREGRIVEVRAEDPKEYFALVSGPILVKLPKARPEHCFERPHRKWPVRR